MKKNVQRINESQLRAIVAESVKNVLNELDWKTYANAANKMGERYKNTDYGFPWMNNKDAERQSKDFNRIRKFNDAAGKALSDKYGRKLCTWGDWNGDQYVMDDKPFYPGTNAEGPSPSGYYYRSSKDRDWRDVEKSYQDGDFEEYGDIPYDRDKYSWESDEDYNKDLQANEIGREVDNYTHGRYAYNNEKGWHLKNK